ncbi:MAG: iron-containing redox enzyme family protein [Byssovorax sp.]
MKLVNELEQVADSCVRAVERAPVVGGVLAGTCSREDYATFLAQTYHYVKLTAPGLLRAAAALRGAGRYPALVALYLDKAVEEAGHDVWAADDATRNGAGAIASAAPTPAVQAYLAWNRFTIATGSPVAFFGTAYVLERLGATCAPRAVKNLLASGAVRPEALRFLAGHGEADQGHIAELGDALAQVDDPADQEAILRSAEVTAALYPRFFVHARDAA